MKLSEIKCADCGNRLFAVADNGYFSFDTIDEGEEIIVQAIFRCLDCGSDDNGDE
jgi:DNA-directed RNA polymerase subunit RPC12/RpoP